VKINYHKKGKKRHHNKNKKKTTDKPPPPLVNPKTDHASYRWLLHSPSLSPHFKP
jgi:hypothetical protein